MSNKILALGDFHLSDLLPYGNYISDGREKEKKEILKFIIDKSKDINKIIMLGDLFHTKNPSSKVIKDATEFLEFFHNKEVYIIGGNHENLQLRSAIDYLAEIKNPLWHVVPFGVKTIGDFDLCAYHTKAELEVKTNEDGAKKLMESLKGNRFLIAHHGVSNTLYGSTNTDFFDEIVLPRKELETRYRLILIGHIHSKHHQKNILTTGSIFTREVNEPQKYIHVIDEDTLEIESIELPGRGIYKLIDPSDKDISEIKDDSIVKVMLTKKKTKKEIKELKDKLERFDAAILIEDYPKERKKFASEKNVLEFGIHELLALYSKERGISLNKLMSAFKLII